MTDALTSLDKSLSTIINGATEKGAKLVDFLYSEAPEVINQLLMWTCIESALNCLVGLILILGVPVFWFFCVKKWQNFVEKEFNENIFSFEFIFPTVFSFTLIVLPIVFAMGANSLNLVWLKIWIAPKIFLLEYIAQLAK